MRPLHLPDRIILEQTIIPALDYGNVCGNVCFVGTDKHTDHYPSLFSQASLFILNKDGNRFLEGSVQNLLGNLQDLDKIAGKNFFDVIIANGLAGYGTDTPEEVEKCFNGAYESLKIGGIFVWGWSDSSHLRIIDPIFINHHFRPYLFNLLGTWRYSTILAYDPTIQYHATIERIINQNHTFDFYKK